jgi:hypothetical protein
MTERLQQIRVALANTVEEACGAINLTKNQFAYRTATFEAAGTVPEMLPQIQTKAGG